MKSDPAKILCIDDEEPGLELRKLLLESAGYHVITARSGAEGIQLFRFLHCLFISLALAGGVNAVGEQDDRFAPFDAAEVLIHHLVHCIVKPRA